VSCCRSTRAPSALKRSCPSRRACDPRRDRRRGARSVAALHRADVHQPPRGLRHHAPAGEAAAWRVLAEVGGVSGSAAGRPRIAFRGAVTRLKPSAKCRGTRRWSLRIRTAARLPFRNSGTGDQEVRRLLWVSLNFAGVEAPGRSSRSGDSGAHPQPWRQCQARTAFRARRLRSCLALGQVLAPL
jgi:hypothetical protein